MIINHKNMVTKMEVESKQNLKETQRKYEEQIKALEQKIELQEAKITSVNNLL